MQESSTAEIRTVHHKSFGTFRTVAIDTLVHWGVIEPANKVRLSVLAWSSNKELGIHTYDLPDNTHPDQLAYLGVNVACRPLWTQESAASFLRENAQLIREIRNDWDAFCRKLSISNVDDEIVRNYQEESKALLEAQAKKDAHFTEEVNELIKNTNWAVLGSREEQVGQLTKEGLTEALKKAPNTSFQNY